jgi:hypothetical protein
MIWLHRRFFERVGRREREFEARVARGVRLAALFGGAQSLAEIEAALRAQIGKRSRLVATLAGYPWPNYELELRLERSRRVLTLVATRAELARVHGRPAPALVTVLSELIAAHGDAIEDHWLAPEMIYGTGNTAGNAGYQVHAGEAKPKVALRERAPSWLAEAKPADRDSGPEQRPRRGAVRFRPQS